MLRTSLAVAYVNLFLGTFGVLCGLNPRNDDHGTALLLGVLLLIVSVVMFFVDHIDQKN